MASWCNLPKELKWLIFNHIIVECSVKYRFSYYGFFTKSFGHIGNTKINPSFLCMHELFSLLSLVNKESRAILQSKTIFIKNSVVFKIKK